MPATAPSRLRLVPIVIAQAFGIGCGVAGVKLNSSLVPPDVLGHYGLFLTFAPVGMWVVHAGLLKFTARHWAAAESRASLLRAIALAWARRLPWLALGAAAGAFVLAGTLPDRLLLGLSLFYAASLLAAAALAQTALQAEGSHWKDCAVAISGSLTRTFAPPWLFVACGGAIAALWLGFAAHALVAALAGACALAACWSGSARNPGDTPAIGAAYRGALFTVLALSGWVVAGVNRWIIAAFFGETEAGYFTLTGGAAVVLTSSLGTVFMQYFQPGVFRLGDDPASPRAALARRVDAIALGHAGAAIAAVALLAFVAPWLVGPLINPRYQDALRWIVPAGCFGAATITPVFYQSMLLAGRRERACAVVDLSTAAVLILGCLVSAAAGRDWLARWLTATPLVPWVLTRTLARRFLFRPDAVPEPAPAR